MTDDDISDDVVAQLFADLSDRDKQVLEDRFSVDLSCGTNREILAAMLEITQEKIEAIERKALRNSRTGMKSDQLPCGVVMS